MADNGDPLLALPGYRDALNSGVVVARRSRLNFIGGTVTDNPTLSATDIDISGLAPSAAVLAATATLAVDTINRYDGSAVATYTFPASPSTGARIAVAEVSDGSATVTFAGGGSNLGDPTAPLPGSVVASMTIGQPRAFMLWTYDGTVWILTASPVTPEGTVDWKDSVRAATTAALPANTRADNVLTADAPGALPSQDTVALAAGQELLVKNEGTAADNGPYVVTDAGGVGPWILTRRDDFDSSAEVTSMAVIPVSEGAVNGQMNFQLVTADPITINITSLSFVAFGGAVSSWTAVLAVGASSGGTSPILTSGDSLKGADAATGGNAPVVGGVGSGGVGGDASLTGGSGSTDGGDAIVSAGAKGAGVDGDVINSIPGTSTNFFWDLNGPGGSNLMALGAVPSTMTNGSSVALAFTDLTTVSIGYVDRPSGTGRVLKIIGQTSGDAAGGDIEVFPGKGNDTNSGRFFISTQTPTGTNGAGGVIRYESAPGVGTGKGGDHEYEAGAGGATGQDGEFNFDMKTGGSTKGSFRLCEDAIEVRRTQTGALTTVNATPVTIATFATTADDSVILLDLRAVAIDATANEVASYRIAAVFHRSSVSTVTQKKFEFYASYEDDAAWTVTANISSQDIQIQVTGDGVNTTKWRLVGDMTEHS